MMRLLKGLNRLWSGNLRPIRSKRERAQTVQAIEIKYQQGAIRQANRSSDDREKTEMDTLSVFGVAVYDMLKSANVSEVHRLSDEQLHAIDMIRCAYFDDADTFEAKLAPIGEAMREALLEARGQAMGINPAT